MQPRLTSPRRTGCRRAPAAPARRVDLHDPQVGQQCQHDEEQQADDDIEAKRRQVPTPRFNSRVRKPTRAAATAAARHASRAWAPGSLGEVPERMYVGRRAGRRPRRRAGQCRAAVERRSRPQWAPRRAVTAHARLAPGCLHAQCGAKSSTLIRCMTLRSKSRNCAASVRDAGARPAGSGPVAVIRPVLTPSTRRRFSAVRRSARARVPPAASRARSPLERDKCSHRRSRVSEGTTLASLRLAVAGAK